MFHGNLLYLLRETNKTMANNIMDKVMKHCSTGSGEKHHALASISFWIGFIAVCGAAEAGNALAALIGAAVMFGPLYLAGAFRDPAQREN